MNDMWNEIEQHLVRFDFDVNIFCSHSQYHNEKIKLFH